MVSRILLVALASLVLLGGADFARAQTPSPSATAAEKHSSDLLATWINARFEELWKQAGVEQKETVDDATYLRRAPLDPGGQTPHVAPARGFLRKPPSGKRHQIVRHRIGDSRRNTPLARS